MSLTQSFNFSVDATRSDYNAEMLEEVSKSSSSSSNDSFTSMPNTARKLSDEIMEKKLPNNNSFPSEKSAGTGTYCLFVA